MFFGVPSAPQGRLPLKITAVESTTLSTIAYDEARGLLQLEFCSGAIYQYSDVALSFPSGHHRVYWSAPADHEQPKSFRSML